VLLFRGGDPGRPQAGTWWFTPGGGIDPGESTESAARRELKEETGLAVARIGPVVLRRHVEHEFEGVRYAQEEEFFAVRCSRFELSQAGWTATERRVVVEYRWWTQAELCQSQAMIYPSDLAAVLELLQGPGPGANPAVVGRGSPPSGSRDRKRSGGAGESWPGRRPARLV